MGSKFIQFKKWSCGCIGITTDNKVDIVVKPCDRDSDDPYYHFFHRYLEDKKWEYLSEEESTTHLYKIQRLLSDGDFFQTLRYRLQIPEKK